MAGRLYFLKLFQTNPLVGPTRQQEGKVPRETLTSVRASTSQAVAATARAALLCTRGFGEPSGPMRACMRSWLCMVPRRGSCSAMLVSTVAALATAPSRLLDRVFINGSIPSASATALSRERKNRDQAFNAGQKILFGAHK